MILPIGYQPFMRCHSQYAYGIHMKEPFPLQDDIQFEKLHFRHSVELSKRVFDMMDEGKKIYPQEGLDEFSNTIESIRHATNFSEEAFWYALKNKNTTGLSREELIEQLKLKQILGTSVEITGDIHPFKVTRAQIRRLNKKYVGFSFRKAFGIPLHYRSVYCPPANKKPEEEA